MNSMIRVCLITLVVTCVAGAQQSTKPPLQRGIHVEMATASHAAPMPTADQPDATVVGITADGKVFLGAQPTDVAALGGLKQGTVFVKADAHTPYQKLLAVLDALRGHSVVLLTAAPSKAKTSTPVPAYGLQLTVGGK